MRTRRTVCNLNHHYHRLNNHYCTTHIRLYVVSMEICNSHFMLWFIYGIHTTCFIYGMHTTWFIYGMHTTWFIYGKHTTWFIYGIHTTCFIYGIYTGNNMWSVQCRKEYRIYGLYGVGLMTDQIMQLPNKK